MAWSEQLEALTDAGILTGFALLTAGGVAEPATGPFADDPAAVRQLSAPFYSAADAAPTSVEFKGRRLVLVASSPGDYVAVSARHALCVAARHLPCGTLLASFAAPVRAQAVALELDRCAAALQA